MGHPQTVAKEIGAHCEEIGRNGCLALCYARCAGVGGGDAELIRTVARAMDEGVIGRDCYVTDAARYLAYLSGGRYSVQKKQLGADGIAAIKEPTPVRYEFGGASHWVVVEDGRIAFDPLLGSACVAKGAPKEARVIVRREAV